MRKRFYMFCATLSLFVVSSHAQFVIENNVTLTEPAAWGDMGVAGEVVIIDDVTVTFGNDAMNICGFPAGDGTSITLNNGSKVVMYDSPNLWMPDVDAPENEEFIDDLQNIEGVQIEKTPFNFVIEGAATIEADTKCKIGGKYTGTGELTLIVGDSTALCADFSQFAGTLKIQHKGSNNTFLFGDGYPGTVPGDDKPLNSVQCWSLMNWTLVVPDGLDIKTLTVIPMVVPKVIGKGNFMVDHFFIFRPSESFTFEGTVTGDGSNNRAFELFATDGIEVTLTQPIDYVAPYAYVRSKGYGYYVNSDRSLPSFSGIVNSISMRNNEAFVGGTGWVACGVEGKDGNTSRITPGVTGDNSIGAMRISTVWFNNNNGYNIDFDGGGLADILMTDSVNFQGANHRPYLNFMEGFAQNPVAGDYKVIDAGKYKLNYVNPETGANTAVVTLVNGTSYTSVDENGYVCRMVDLDGDEVAETTEYPALPEGYFIKMDKYLTEGIISIMGPGYEPVIRNTLEKVDGSVGIEDVLSSDNKEIVARQYYSINGVALQNPQRGFNIVRVVYSDGSVKAEKVFVKD